MSSNITTTLEPGTFYHIFNRGNDGINIFYKGKNYRYFLTKYDQYMSGYVDTYCFCLLPNHFHLLAKVKPSDDVARKAAVDFPKNFSEEGYTDARAVSERFRRFFMSYAKSINQQEGRSGSLFQKYFRRQAVTDDAYFTRLIWHIHNNAVHHGLHDNLETYSWSSYQRILTDKPSKLMKEEVLAWFGGRDNYVAFHRDNTADTSAVELLLLE